MKVFVSGKSQKNQYIKAASGWAREGKSSGIYEQNAALREVLDFVASGALAGRCRLTSYC